MSAYDTSSATVQGTVYLYGYVLPVNPNKTVSQLAISNDVNIKILAINDVNQPPQVNLAAGTNQAPTADNQQEITSTLTPNLVAGNSFSAALQPYGLGNTVSWNLQTFDIGPAAYNDVMALGGVSINLPQGNFTSLQLLGASMSGHFETAMLWVHYTDGTYDTFTQDFSDWLTGYNGTFGSTAPGESIALQMNTYNNSSTGVVNQKADLYGYVLPLNPNKTVQYLQITNDVNIKILAVDEVDQPEQVNLGHGVNSSTPAFNSVGITMNGLSNVGAGLDGSGDSYSADLLGSTMTWNSQVFEMGPASANTSLYNVVEGSGYPPIQLPQGYYTSIQLLATAAGGYPTSGQFYVDYTDGSTDVFSLGLSDWHNGFTGAGTTMPWETIAATMSYYNTSTGSSSSPPNTHLYGYVLPTNPNKIVEDVREPNNAGVRILAIDVVDQSEEVNLGDAVSSASPAFNTVGITMNSETQVSGGIDGGGDSFSANALGTTVNWNGQTFNVSPASALTYIPNVVMASGSPPIAVPQGHYTSIQVLATAAFGPVSDQWYVDYTDGSTDTFTLGVSDWIGGYDGATTTASWESIALPMSSYNRDVASGNTSGNVYLYGYVLRTNPAKVVEDVRAERQ